MSAPGNQKSAQPGLKTAREYALIEGFARLIGNLNQSRLPLPVDGVVQSIPKLNPDKIHAHRFFRLAWENIIPIVRASFYDHCFINIMANCKTTFRQSAKESLNESPIC